jgi:hypothetical protein
VSGIPQLVADWESLPKHPATSQTDISLGKALTLTLLHALGATEHERQGQHLTTVC